MEVYLSLQKSRESLSLSPKKSPNSAVVFTAWCLFWCGPLTLIFHAINFVCVDLNIICRCVHSSDCFSRNNLEILPGWQYLEKVWEMRCCMHTFAGTFMSGRGQVGQGFTDNSILRGALQQTGTQGGQEAGLAAERGTCGHVESAADRSLGSVPGPRQDFLLQNFEVAWRRISSKGLDLL